MRVVTYNLHAGVDGYGRANAVVDSAVALAPDLLFAQEVWRGEHEDQFAELASRCSLAGHFVELGAGERVTAAVGGRGWQSPLALLRGETGLYFDERRELTAHQIARRRDAPGRQSGVWGLALLTRCEIVEITVGHLSQLRRDKVRRAYVVAELVDRGQRFFAVAVHGAHLSHGSLGQYRELARRLDELSSRAPVILGGDFNCWRPLLRTVLPGWTSGVRARTWPAWRAHSQIDHLLLRGPWELGGGSAVTGPSDHRALVLEARLRAPD
jgi:endonuclease/exonuclease/phosphatase family metal-dependent hydrolase